MSRKRPPRGWHLFHVRDRADIVSNVIPLMRIKSISRQLTTTELRQEWVRLEAKSTKARRLPVLVSGPLRVCPIVWLPSWIYPSAFGHSFGCTGFDNPEDARRAILDAMWCEKRRRRIFSARTH